MGNNGKRAVLLLLLLILTFQSQGYPWPWKWNQVNKKGDRTGRWRDYYSHKPEQLQYTGHFKNGKSRGTWKTYSPDGHLERLEKYKKAGKAITTTFYYPNGKVAKKGTAYLFEENGLLKYKWHGDWHYYDSLGTWQGWKSFNQGKALSDAPILSKRSGKN